MAAEDNVLKVELKGDKKSLEDALNKASKEVKEYSRSTSAAIKTVEKNTGGMLIKGAALSAWTVGIKNAFQGIAGLIQSTFGSFIEAADNIDKMSKRLKIGTEDLQLFKYAAEQSGSNIDEVTDAIKTFQQTLGAAQLGDSGSINKLKATGINPEDFIGKNGSEQFKMLADSIASVQDPAERTRVAIELFGESGYKLLPMLEGGSKGLDEFRKQGQEAGAIMGGDMITAGVTLKKVIGDLKTSFEYFKNTLIVGFVPYLTAIIEFANELFRIFSRYPIITKIVSALTFGVIALNMALNANPLLAVGSAIISVISVMNLFKAKTQEQTQEIDNQTKAENKLAEARRLSAEAEKKKQLEIEKTNRSNQAKQDLDRQREAVSNRGKSSQQREIEDIDKDINLYKTNFKIRKKYLENKSRRGQITEEEINELWDMEDNGAGYISTQRNRQREIRGEIVNNMGPSRSAESDNYTAASRKIADLQAQNAAPTAIAEAQKELEKAKKELSDVTLRAKGEERNVAATAYENARADYENYNGTDLYERDRLYNNMIRAREKSDTADTAFASLAEQSYGMNMKNLEHVFNSGGGTFNAFAMGSLGDNYPKMQFEELVSNGQTLSEINEKLDDMGVFE